MATIKYKINNDWVDIKDIVGPVNSTALVDLSSVLGNTGTAQRRPWAQGKAGSSGNITVNCSTSYVQVPGASNGTGGTDGASFFSVDANGIGIKKQGAFYIGIKGNIYTPAATQLQTEVRTQVGTGTLSLYDDFAGYLHIPSGMVNTGFYDFHGVTVAGNEAANESSGTPYGFRPTLKANNTVTAYVSASYTKMEAAPLTRAMYGKRTKIGS